MTDGATPLAVSLGDPAGIGPEIIVQAWAARAQAGLTPFFVAGGRSVLEAVSSNLGGDVPVIAIDSPADAFAAFEQGLPVLGAADCGWRPGIPDRAGAQLAFDSLQQAASLVCAGHASALVTGPIAKARLAEVGFSHPGQTEWVAEACGINPEDAVMMLAGPSLRTVPLTVHVALAAVPALLSAALIERRGAIVAAALRRDFGLAAPRLAVAALNPHAGEEGRMGDEDQRIVAPAIAALRERGIDASGPHPADALKH